MLNYKGIIPKIRGKTKKKRFSMTCQNSNDALSFATKNTG